MRSAPGVATTPYRPGIMLATTACPASGDSVEPSDSYFGQVTIVPVIPSAACVMGALSEGLVGPVAPEAPDLADTRALVDAIIGFCLQAVSAAPHAHSSRVGGKR